MYVKGVKTRDIHIFAPNFLIIQLILNPIKDLERRILFVDAVCVQLLVGRMWSEQDIEGIEK